MPLSEAGRALRDARSFLKDGIYSQVWRAWNGCRVAWCRVRACVALGLPGMLINAHMHPCVCTARA